MCSYGNMQKIDFESMSQILLGKVILNTGFPCKRQALSRHRYWDYLVSLYTVTPFSPLTNLTPIITTSPQSFKKKKVCKVYFKKSKQYTYWIKPYKITIFVDQKSHIAAILYDLS